jgi:hypothetical protein
MTNFERFQAFQVELVRAGFGTTLEARPSGSGATIALLVDLERKDAETVERLDQLAAQHGFSFKLDAESRAALTLLDE